MSSMSNSLYVLPNDTDIVLLDCKKAFINLTNQEKLYAHYLSQASWYGSLIVLLQTSPESPLIFVLLQKLYRTQSVTELQSLAIEQCGLSETEFQALLIYSAGIYCNMGNYKSFGDTKFIPNLPKEKFKALINASSAYKNNSQEMESLWNFCSSAMYSLNEKELQLGLGDKGITTYFSENCDMKDAEIVQKFITEYNIGSYNSRMFKREESDGSIVYEIRLASEHPSEPQDNDSKDVTQILKCFDFESLKFEVTRGDYSKLLTLVIENLKEAKEVASNETQVQMLEEYIQSFTTGSLRAHKEGSRFWIKDKGPIIESYIGFIETYRDPFGVRGEFEGFVAMVNKEMSAKFSELVNRAEQLLPLLPWPKEYEKDKFLQPDFTSLDVLTFAGSGIPAGINIPNYDEIRQDEGFKNVSLGNVLSAGYKEEKISFLSDEDKELFKKYKISSFEVQVGLHELLGHGSGKLFVRDKDEEFNFDIDTVKHTETNEKISSWYEATDTYDSKFSVISSSYEECRAESVGLFLCLSKEVLKIFGYVNSTAEDIIYVNWLIMVRAGLLGLEYYSPQTKSWRQAHMQARYVILKVLLEAGEKFVNITQVSDVDGKPNLLITLDRSKIETVGKTAMSNFLRKLQVYKATADYQTAKTMYDHYSEVNDDGEPCFLSLRSIVLDRKQPRKMFVQVNTSLNDGDVSLKEYLSSAAGLITSFKDRFLSDDIDDILLELWEKDKKYWKI